MMVDTYWEEQYKSIKYMVVFLTGESEATNPENMEDLYASVRSWGMRTT